MHKAILLAALYAFALLCVWAATTIAPDMTWPETPLEMNAASLLALGMIAKMAGHVVLMSASKRQYS